MQKFLTGGLVMQAINQNKLSLDDHLDKFYPTIPGAQQISISDLLNMHSGLTLKKGASLGKVPFQSDDPTLQATIPDIEFKPELRSKFDYETINYAILSNILEKVTNKSYQDLFTDTYIKGQKLNSTAFVWDDQNELNRINFVANPLNLDEVHGELGAGSVAMSNDDLFTIASRMLSGKIIDPNSVNNLYQLDATVDGGYHGGFYAKDNYVYANGAGYHYYTFLRVSKDGQNGMIYQTNQGSKYYQTRTMTMNLWESLQGDNNYDSVTKTVKKPVL